MSSLPSFWLSAWITSRELPTASLIISARSVVVLTTNMLPVPLLFAIYPYVPARSAFDLSVSGALATANPGRNHDNNTSHTKEPDVYMVPAVKNAASALIVSYQTQYSIVAGC